MNVKIIKIILVEVCLYSQINNKISVEEIDETIKLVKIIQQESFSSEALKLTKLVKHFL